MGYPDSNQERQDQNLQCYHYTIAQCLIAMQRYNIIFKNKQIPNFFITKCRKIFQLLCEEAKNGVYNFYIDKKKVSLHVDDYYWQMGIMADILSHFTR